eukprot:3960600-Pyramimonas_sp.AAC.1
MFDTLMSMSLNAMLPGAGILYSLMRRADKENAATELADAFLLKFEEWDVNGDRALCAYEIDKVMEKIWEDGKVEGEEIILQLYMCYLQNLMKASNARE